MFINSLMHSEPAMRYAMITLLLLASILLAGCQPEPAAESTVRPVIVDQVQPVTSARTASYTGTIHARFETWLSFRVGGKVAERMVSLGDRVEAGQVLARLDATNVRLAVEAARAQLEAAREQYELARRQFERAQALFKHNATSQSVYDRRKAKLETAAAQLEQAKKHYAIQQNRLTYTRLRATQAGVITQVRVQPGQVVSAGQPVFGFARTGQRQLRITVPESRIDTITTGERVEITFWALPGVRIRGRVRTVAADTNARTSTYPVRIALLEQPDSLRLGMTATAHFRDQLRDPVIRLPLTSLYHAGDQPAVWVVDKSSHKVTLQPVHLLRYEAHAVILAPGRGLQSGALVVTKGVSKLHAGQRVEPIDSFLHDNGNDS